MEKYDHFNWPSPQRRDTMSLSKIDNDRKILKDRQSSSLFSNDIEGSRAVYKQSLDWKKECLVNKCEDINLKPPQNSNPINRSLYIQNEDPLRDFRNIKDIVGPKKYFKTNRLTNPLLPTYNLPSYQTVQPEESKFIRNTLNIRDIEGAFALPDTAFQKQRNVNPYTEIEGTKAMPRFIPRDAINRFDVKEINNERIFKSTRTTNPLLPTYYIPKLLGDPNIESYGEIKGAQAQIKHPDLNKEKSTSLTSKDIDGAHANSLSQRIFDLNNKRRQYLEPNRTADIEGAQSNTLKKGIQTSRQTNPNMPSYLNPDKMKRLNLCSSRIKFLFFQGNSETSNQQDQRSRFKRSASIREAGANSLNLSVGHLNEQVNQQQRENRSFSLNETQNKLQTILKSPAALYPSQKDNQTKTILNNLTANDIGLSESRNVSAITKSNAQKLDQFLKKE